MSIVRTSAITTPPTQTLLTTVEMAQAVVGPLNSASDTVLLSHLIARASAQIAAYCNRAFGVERRVDTFRPGRRVWGIGLPYDSYGHGPESLVLARPQPTLVSVTLDGTTLTADEDFDLEPDAGILRRLSSPGAVASLIPWRFSAVVATYDSGWVLPEETQPQSPARTLPADIEGACLELTRAAWSGRDRDPLLRSEQVYNVGSSSYAAGVGGSGAIADGDAVSAMLARYRIAHGT